MVMPPLKNISTPCFLQIILHLSLMPCIYGTTVYGLLLLPVLLLLLDVPLLVLILFFCLMLAPDRAHSGYLHLLRALLSRLQQITTLCASTSPLTTSIDLTTETTVGSTDETTTATTKATVATTSETTEQSNKWVKNLLEVPLTEAQVSLLAYGPNFTIGSRRPPMGSTLLLWNKHV